MNLSWHVTSLIVVISYLAKWKLCKINNVSPLPCSKGVKISVSYILLTGIRKKLVLANVKHAYRCNTIHSIPGQTSVHLSLGDGIVALAWL